jgi:hypothetical protein
MSIKLTALDVNVGDSFIIETANDKVFMIDGGQNQRDIVFKLCKRKTSHIDVLICSHYDKDHFNGILGIVKSHKFVITDIFLPAIFGDIALTISKNQDIINNFISIYTELLKKDCLFIKNWFIENYEIVNKRYPNIESHDGFCAKNLFNVSSLHSVANSLKKLFCQNSSGLHIQVCSSLKIIRKINELMINLCGSGTHIHWLQYDNHLKDVKILFNHPIFAQNSYEVACYELLPHELVCALMYLTQINKESLVFKYRNRGFPDVLFTADSALDFTNCCHPIKLKDKSIVTAPHHGSFDNTGAYNLIQGNDLIFVRSDKFQKKRPCLQYIKLPTKYCTKCKNSNQRQEVILDFNFKTKQWVHGKTNPCICK